MSGRSVAEGLGLGDRHRYQRPPAPPIAGRPRTEQSCAAPDQVESCERTGPDNPIVLAETVWTIRRKLGGTRNDIAPRIEQLLETDGFEVMFTDAARRALDGYRSGTADFVDGFLAEINAEIGCQTTFTFDQDAARSRAFSPVP